jgi:hypothetical protein
MRKLIVFLLAAGLLFVLPAPVPAADKTVEERLQALEDTIGSWTIYGSARFGTFYQKDSAGDVGAGGLFNDDNKTTIWDMQGNSRIGFAAKHGDLGGDLLLGIHDTGVTIRHAFGSYQCGDLNFLIGKGETIFTNFTYSNQAGNPYTSDTDLQDWGFIDENFSPLVQMTYKGLTVQLVQTSPTVALSSSSATATYETLLPHLEVQYHLAVDKFYGDVYGGAGTFKVKDVDTITVDTKVNSYTVGIGGGANIDPAFCGASIWYGRNATSMGVVQVTGRGALIDAVTGDVTNEKDLGVAAVVGAKIQKVTVEAGYGFTSSQYDESGAPKIKGQSYYLQAVVPIAETKNAKCFVVPEVGVFDQNDNDSGFKMGKTTYAGAKWQIDF